jgi:hypothetical protein
MPLYERSAFKHLLKRLLIYDLALYKALRLIEVAGREYAVEEPVDVCVEILPLQKYWRRWAIVPYKAISSIHLGDM